MRVWVFTDSHWHQDGNKIGRPEDHTDRQFINLCRMINPDDLLIHCGDVTWKPRSLYTDLAHIPCKKVLVRGNHDKESLPWYMRNGFDFACDSFVFKKVLFTHAPANALPGNALLNVHGHLHNIPHHEHEPMPWHRLLAIENTNYAPVAFDKFVGNLGSL